MQLGGFLCLGSVDGMGNMLCLGRHERGRIILDVKSGSKGWTLGSRRRVTAGNVFPNVRIAESGTTGEGNEGDAIEMVRDQQPYESCPAPVTNAEGPSGLL